MAEPGARVTQVVMDHRAQLVQLEQKVKLEPRETLVKQEQQVTATVFDSLDKNNVTNI